MQRKQNLFLYSAALNVDETHRRSTVIMLSDKVTTPQPSDLVPAYELTWDSSGAEGILKLSSKKKNQTKQPNKKFKILLLKSEKTHWMNERS